MQIFAESQQISHVQYKCMTLEMHTAALFFFCVCVTVTTLIATGIPPHVEFYFGLWFLGEMLQFIYCYYSLILQ